MGVMMAKKFKDRRAVFQFRTAILTQYQENFSESTSEVAAPWESSCMRWIAAIFSSGVRNLEFEGVCGRKNMVRMPKRMVIAPSTKKMNGLDICECMKAEKMEFLTIHDSSQHLFETSLLQEGLRMLH